MDYKQMTAPCGLDCFNCMFYLADKDDQARDTVEIYCDLMGMDFEGMLCQGCRAHQGKIPTFKYSFGQDYVCGAWRCISEKGHDFCHECGDFPCDLLHPFADRADKLPHNIKAFNLCQIKKMGLDKWAEEQAARTRQTYFHKWWTLG